MFFFFLFVFFFQAEDGIRDLVRSRGLGDVYKRQGKIQRLTTDGGETVFNGALDWVYNEELATRAAQPAYAWSPDGNWLLYLLSLIHI